MRYVLQNLIKEKVSVIKAVSYTHLDVYKRQPEGVEMVMPGDNVAMTVELIAPIAVEKGTKFSIREGGRTVGAGSVVDILE